MIDPKVIDDLVKKLSAAVPPALQTMKEDLEKNFRVVLQSALTKLNLVSREEFDVQVGVLNKTRTKLETLEKKLAELEERRKNN